MSVEINRDIDKFQESVVLGLTAKQLIASVLSVLVGGAIVLISYKKWDLRYQHILQYLSLPRLHSADFIRLTE